MRGWLTGLAIVAATAFSAPAASAQDFSKIASDILHQRLPGDTTTLSKGDVVSGLKEALTKGAEAAAKRVGARNGYFGDPAIRIPLPGVLGDAQKKLQPFGMAGPLDDLQLRVNRAAEAAAPTGRKLMIDAVKSMTIEDGLSVLRGGDTAATDLLRKRTVDGLRTAFRPYFEEALSSSGAITALDGAVAKYGAGLIKTDPKAWLTDNATTGALDGLFYYVAREEQAIRHDPVKRTSDLLRRVFGG
jgi:hypothetical protein